MSCQDHYRIRLSASAPMGLAVLALLMGLAIYVLDRPAASAYFLTQWSAVTDSGEIQTGVTAHYFGALGLYLPTFLHTYAFILLTRLLPSNGFEI